jgi:hypothetical protein
LADIIDLACSFLDMLMSKALGESNTEPENYTVIFEVFPGFDSGGAM